MGAVKISLGREDQMLIKSSDLYVIDDLYEEYSWTIGRIPINSDPIHQQGIYSSQT